MLLTMANIVYKSLWKRVPRGTLITIPNPASSGGDSGDEFHESWLVPRGRFLFNDPFACGGVDYRNGYFERGFRLVLCPGVTDFLDSCPESGLHRSVTQVSPLGFPYAFFKLFMLRHGTLLGDMCHFNFKLKKYIYSRLLSMNIFILDFTHFFLTFIKKNMVFNGDWVDEDLTYLFIYCLSNSLVCSKLIGDHQYVQIDHLLYDSTSGPR